MRVLCLTALLAAAAWASCPLPDSAYIEPVLELPLSGFAAWSLELYFVVREPEVEFRTYAPPYYIGFKRAECFMGDQGPADIPYPVCEAGRRVGPFVWNSSAAEACGFANSTVGEDIIFTNSLFVEWLDPNSETGTGTAAIPFQLILRHYRYSATNISIYDPINAQAVLSYVEVSLDTTNASNVVIKLSATVGALKPFDLANSATAPPAIVGTATIVKDPQSEVTTVLTTSTFVWKKFNYVITPGASVTKLDQARVYLKFDAGCQTGSQCPFTSTYSTQIVASILLSTDSFQSKLVDTALVNGTMSFWSSPTFTVPKQPAYWEGEMVYVKMSFAASKIGIASWNRTSLTVNGEPPEGIQDLNWDGVTAANAIDGVPGSLDQSRFRFVARLPASTPDEGSAQMTIRATYTITYDSSKRKVPWTRAMSFSRLATFSRQRLQKGAASRLAPWWL
eukprot:m51a1_g5759 hypothetical protein (451) ;mRNA; f:1211725-1213077